MTGQLSTYLDLLAVVVELVFDDGDDAVGADRLGLGGQSLCSDIERERQRDSFQRASPEEVA